MTLPASTIWQSYLSHEEACAAVHPGPATEEDCKQAVEMTAAVHGVSLDEVRRIVADNAVKGAC